VSLGVIDLQPPAAAGRVLSELRGKDAAAEWPAITTGTTNSLPADLPDAIFGLPLATLGTSYSFTFGVRGGSPPYTWSIVSGAPPPGLMFQADGTLSGMPSSPGSCAFRVRVQDRHGRADEKTFGGTTLNGASAAPKAPAAEREPPAEVPRVAALFSPDELSFKGDGRFSLVVVGAQSLTSVEAILNYDPELVEVLDVQPGLLLTLDGSLVGSETSLGAGRVRARFFRQSGLTGSGDVIIYRVRGVRPGASLVRIEALNVATSGGAAPLTLPASLRVTVQP